MPNIANEQTITASEAARRVGVEVYTLRRWCEWHSVHLSPGANPGEGQNRRLTLRDVEVLRHVRTLRDNGLQTKQINEQLQGIAFAVPDSPEATPEPPESITGDLAPILGIDSQMAVRALVGRLDAIERSQRDRFTWFLFGFLACGVVFGLLLLLAIAFR